MHSFQFASSSYFQEVTLLIKTCIPTVLALFTQSICGVLTVLFVGQMLSTTDFDAVAIGTTSVNLTGFSILAGFLSSMDTLLSQAYGASQWRIYSLTTQRAIVMSLSFTIFIAILWFFMGSILIHCGQPTDAALLAGHFCRIYILLLPGMAFIEIQRRFLICQSVLVPQLILSFVVYVFCHPFILYWMVPKYGVTGAAFADVISNYLFLFTVQFYVMVIKPHHSLSFQRWSWDIFSWHTDHEGKRPNLNFLRRQKKKSRRRPNKSRYSKITAQITSIDATTDDLPSDSNRDEDNNNDSAIDGANEVNHEHSKSDTQNQLVSDENENLASPNSEDKKKLLSPDRDDDIVLFENGGDTSDESINDDDALTQYSGFFGFITLGFAGATTWCIEWWAFEAITLFAGMLGEIPLASHVIFTNVVAVIAILPLGVSIGAATRVGYLIGARRYRMAQQLCGMIWLISVVTSLICSFLIMILHHTLPAIFSRDPYVIKSGSSLAIFVAGFVIVDSLQCVGLGILRGIHQQTKGAKVVVLSMWCIGIPCALILGFALNRGVSGLWLGLIVGYITLVAFVFKIFRNYEWTERSTYDVIELKPESQISDKDATAQLQLDSIDAADDSDDSLAIFENI